MASYATPGQLAYAMGNLAGFASGSAQETRALQLLEDATDVINGELEIPLGQDMLSTSTTVTLDGTGTCELVLPRHPVSAVSAVVEIDRQGVETVLVFGVDYTWSESGVLERIGGVWPCHHRSVRVTYMAGWVEIPKTVRQICCRLAAAGWNNPAGADTEELGDRRVRWHTPGMELSTGEKRKLDPYRMRS